MQYSVIWNDTPFGLSTKEKIMPQYFKEAGYHTSLIGKWHQGFHQRQYTPTMRGFDSFFGYYGGYIDFYSHSLRMQLVPGRSNYSRGLDMRRNLSSNWDVNGTYATDLFTDEAVKTIKNNNYEKQPLFLLLSHLAPHAGDEIELNQAPQSEIDKFKHIPNMQRKTLAAMISILDTGVGKVVKALQDSNQLKNTIIIFYSDNGGPTRKFS
jgi:arylsulfatase B